MDRMIEDILKDWKIRGMPSRPSCITCTALGLSKEHLDGGYLLVVDKEVLKGFIER